MITNTPNPNSSLTPTPTPTPEKTDIEMLPENPLINNPDTEAPQEAWDEFAQNADSMKPTGEVGFNPPKDNFRDLGEKVLASIK